MLFRLFFVLFCGLTAWLPAQTPDISQLDSALYRLHETHRFNGTVLYAEKGKVLYKKAFGVVDYRSGQALQTTSAFNLASVSKQVVCMGIMILREKGMLHYEDDCRQYLPELPYTGINIRHLMTHTSGLPEYFDLFLQYRGPLDTLDNEKLIRLFAEHKPALDFQPGEKWAYCNTNYALLASIIERISREPLSVFLKKRIFDPLDMKDSYVYHVGMPEIPGNHVFGFSDNGDQPTLNDLVYVDGVVGDGNLYSSVEDLLLWEQSLYTEKLVKRQTFAEALKPVILNDGSTHPYGFGWFIQDEKQQWYRHTGSWGGFANLIERDARQNRCIIVLSSSGNGLARQIAQAFFERRPVSVPETRLIYNVRLIDGSGAPARNAAVRVQEQLILAVGNLKPFPGEIATDGQGKVLAPGFIDTHSHLLGYLNHAPEALAALNQGITTIISGQDGESDPIDSIKALMQRRPVAVNVATYTGHATLRTQVMGADQLARAAEPEEIVKMGALLREELKKGSLGLSTGLEYEEGFYSNQHEVIELAKVAAAEKARYISHIRSEDLHLEEAIYEIIAVGREAGLPVQISHIKIALRDRWGTATQWLATLQQARNEGIDITADCYPYDFWNSTVRVLFPNKDFESLAAAQFAVTQLCDPAGSVMVRFAPYPAYAGKTIAEIAELRSESPAQTLLYLVAAADEWRRIHPDAEGVEAIMGKSMSEADVSDFLAWSHTNICSDGGNGGHPRGYGSFTKVLGHYVREKQLMGLETAIHKMTAQAAEHTGIQQRGLITPGFYADLVLFDPETVKDNAGIGNAKALSDGILQVWVNGVPVYQEQKPAGKYPGMFIGR